VAGTATVELALHDDNTARFVVAKLIEATFDGKALLVSDTATPVPPGSGVVRLPMSPTCYTFPQGSRIRLDISCGDYPRFDRRAGSRGGRATLALSSGAKAPSRLIVPQIRSTSTSLQYSTPAGSPHGRQPPSHI
jgi:predicted acyl esterase